MPAFLDKFRIVFTHPIEGDRTMTPINEGCAFTSKSEKESVIYRDDVNTDWYFDGDDYEWLYGIETGSNRCDALDVVIQAYCGGSWVTQRSMQAKMVDIEFNQSKCYAIVKLSINDGYTCLYREWEVEKNLLQQATNRVVKLAIGTIEISSSRPTTSSDPEEYAPPPPGDGWVVYEHTATGGGAVYDISTFYVRETIDWPCDGGVPDQPPGDGWILSVDDCAGSSESTWVRAPKTYLISIVDVPPLQYSETYGVFGQEIEEIDNARLLKEVIEGYIDDCSLSLKSDFFNWNAVGDAPDNDAYTAAADYSYMMIWQKSDIIKYDASENATKGLLALKKLLENLKKEFNIDYKIEGSTLIIEHISFFQASQGLDLVSDYSDDIRGLNSYKYNSEEIPEREKFIAMDEAVSPAFRGYDIIYDSSCTGEDVKEYKSDIFTNDIEEMLTEPDDFVLQGFTLAPTYKLGSDYYFYQSDVSGTSYINGLMSRINLHANFWKWDRYLDSGTMNNVSTNFESVKRLKELPEHVIQLDCSEFGAYDPADLINTDNGWAEVVNMSYDTKTCLMKLKLLA